MFVSAKFRTYCHATEDEDKVRQALRFISGAKDVDIKVTVNKGYHGNEIRVLEAALRKGPKLTTFLEKMVEAGIFEKIKHELPVRLDDECVLYLRFDKQKAYMGNLLLQHGEDTIQVKAKVQAFPAKPDRAVEAIREQVDSIEARLSKKKGH